MLMLGGSASQVPLLGSQPSTRTSEWCQALNVRLEGTDGHQPCACLDDQFQQRGPLTLEARV
jgi:hypothetical protein